VALAIARPAGSPRARPRGLSVRGRITTSTARILHLDGKAIHNADPAPARLKEDCELVEAAPSVDTPAPLQKPKVQKALMLVNFQTPSQRLIDQIAVPQDSNEEAAVAAHLPKMNLAGVLVIGDAAHTVKAIGQLITQEQGGDFLFFLKGNQPTAFAKAQQLLMGAHLLRPGRSTRATE